MTKGRQRKGDIMGRNREDCEKCYPESTSDKGRYPYRESPQSWKATPPWQP